jgi:YD repeat-containing protein
MAKDGPMHADTSTRHRRTLTSGVRARGVAIVETVIALPILLVVILGAIQFGLIYQAKATLNHAALQAARAGAVDHASPEALRSGLARGLLPLYSPDSSLEAVVATIARIETDLAASARIRILNPTREAFDDFAETVEDLRELPNDRLHVRSTAIGARSGLNIQDANLLRVEITYGYELKVPLVNWFITRTLLATRGTRAPDAFTQQLLRRTRLPISATSTVRMQSSARLNELVVSRADLPEGERIDAGAQPPPVDDEAIEDDDTPGDISSDRQGSSLGDGFFGFGEGTGAREGAGDSGRHGGTSDTPPWLGGGEDSGNPQACETPRDDSPGWPFDLPSHDNDASELTSQPVSLPALSVGNPIHVVTGNKYQREVDVAAADGGFEFVRHYNSDSVAYRGSLGRGWRHSFDVSIRRDRESGALTLIQADGRHIRFHATDANRFVARRARDGYVQQNAHSLVWHRDRERSLQFDLDGQLQRILARHIELSLHYDSNARLTTVEDLTGRSLRFTHDAQGRLARLDTPIGAWRYRYDTSGNLIAAIAPNKSVRRYAYGDQRHPHHLTGISITTLELPALGAAPDEIRLGTWTYDERGRGTLSTHPNDRGKITLAYGDGFTDVTDAFGQRTRYITQRRHGIAVVTEVIGPGCGPCMRGDARFEYNDRLQLTNHRERNGAETHFTYDDRARLVEIARALPNAPPLWEVRYYYDDADRLVRIERPSINPEGTHTVDFAHAPSGRLLTSTERGFTPLANGSYAPLERTWRYDYDAHARLVAIDGPRTDAEDAVRIEYDDSGRVEAIISPDGARQRVLERDEIGRPVRMRVTGRPDVEWRYDVAGRVTDLIVHAASGPLVTHVDYDVAGRPRSVRRSDGKVEHFSRDAAGHVVRHAFGGAAFARVSTLASDDQPIMTALQDAKGEISTPLLFVYDNRRRLIELRDGEGPPLRQFRYLDEDEHPDTIIDALGHERSIRYDTFGRVARLYGTRRARIDRGTQWRDHALRIRRFRPPSSRTQSGSGRHRLHI